ncbi:response regulator [Psychromonas arctica]|uniref:response regulator n=1 Tax=Psychromonas arctica TaxID=168275 RepID=UPI002FD3A4A0
MSTPVLICDDSALARKQIALSLPKDWDISIHFANNGLEGVESIRQHKGDVVFLDLNMPVMSGYEVLETIKREDLPAIVIVISGDVQSEAYKRVRELGAIDFIEKPINNEKLTSLLEQYGIYKPGGYNSRSAPEITERIELRDALQEVSNIAMGHAGDLLGRLLDVFILLPVPNVNTLEGSELHMTLSHIAQYEKVSAVSQGFIGSGINGEAIIIFHDASFSDMAKLLQYEDLESNHLEIEVMNDIANILIGAFLNGLAEQLSIPFSQGQPNVLGQHAKIEDIIKNQQECWQKMLTIEVNYRIQDHDIKCDLLLLFTEDSIPVIQTQLGYLLD